MATLNEIIARAEALRKESYVNSIDPERVGSIMSDTLKYLNEFQLQSGSMGLDKIYASVSAMNSDNAPVSDLTGKPLKGGQLAVIVAGSASEDNGKVYRFDNPGWTYVSTIGNLNIVQETGDSETAVMSQKAVTNLIEELKNAGYVFAGIATPETNPGTPDQNVFYIASESGKYVNFGDIELKGEVVILKTLNNVWNKVDIGMVSEERTLQPYFSLKNVKLTDVNISFEQFSFLYLRGASGRYYKRFALAPGTYDLPSEINRAIVVSPTNIDDSNRLIPYITEQELQAYEEPIYMIGYTDSGRKFNLCDSFALANIFSQEVESISQEVESISQEVESISQEVESISQLLVDVPIIIPNETLRKNVNYRLLDDGTITSGSTSSMCVSDFIKIEGLILEKVIATFNLNELESRNVAFAFYENNNEESFITSVREYTSTLVSRWVNYEKKPINIPKNAKYIRISGNTALNSSSPNIEIIKKELIQNETYKDAPTLGYEYFEYDVDTAKEDVENENQSTEIVYPQSISKDNGFIRLPETYSKDGLPTRLVIVNHGAGGRVTDNSSENGNTSFVLLLQKKGYAVLCINGVPQNMRNTNYMDVSQNGAAAHMGGWVYMRSALAAYKYVTEKYNIARDGCYVIGRSMGGVTSLNLAMSGVIPVKALALDAPVIDSFHDAYFSGTWSGGTLGGKNPAIFAWIFQWDYCNFNDNTYTIPIGEYNIFGQNYNVQTEETKPLANLYQNTQDMAILWSLNENKMYGYNAYKTNDFLYKNLDDRHIYNITTDNDDEYFAKKLPCPCKIWFGSGDTINQISIAERFVKKVRNGGSIAMLRTCPTNRHTVWDETETVPGGVDISVIEDGITCSPYGVELCNWLERWDGNVK